MSKLSDLVEFNPSVRLQKGKVAPFIEMAALPTNARDIPEVGEREFKGSGSKFENGDTLFARITPCLENGKGGFVSTLDEGTAGHGSTEFIVMRARSRADSLFVYYVTRAPEFRHFAEKQMSGTSGRQRVAWQSIAEYELPVIEPAQRTAIAATLGALDDKIELNRKMNATLEAMARALFRDWFVDFGPTRARMEGRAPYLSPDLWSLFPDRLDDEGKPEGWEVSPLGELAKVEWGNTSLTKSIYVEEGYPAFSAAGQDGFVTTPERKGLGVVISAIGTVGKIYLASGSWTAIKNTLTVQGETDAVSAFVYYLLQETALPTRGSTQQFISLGDAKAVKVISPDHQFILAFFDLAEPLIRKAIANATESRTLAQTRDLLLPRLMSGELRVAEAERLIGEVA